MLVTVLSVVTSIITIVVMQLLARRNRMGWLLSLANQPLWGLLTYLTGAWGLAILNVVMTVIAIQGYRNWRQNDTR